MKWLFGLVAAANLLLTAYALSFDPSLYRWHYLPIDVLITAVAVASWFPPKRLA